MIRRRFVSSPVCQRVYRAQGGGTGTKVRLRQLVKTWRYALILREKSEPRFVDIRIILKYACTQDFIEVFLLRRP